jgi:hypothetical protein
LQEDEPSEERLSAALDDLAVSYRSVPDREPGSDDRKPPETSYDALRTKIGCRFPSLYLYAIALEPLDPTPALSGVGDALDDLVDIVRDLQDVLWRFSNTSEADAHWRFRLSFETHWGEHMRHLALYLYLRARRSRLLLGARMPLSS